MHGGPDTKKHGNDTSTQDIKGAASVRARFPVHYIGAIAKE